VRTLEHRRHSRREVGSVHLSAEGVELARRVAPGVGRFDRVVTSPLPRAVETARALGFPHPETLDGLAEGPDPNIVGGDVLDLTTFGRYLAAFRRRPGAREYATRQLTLWREALQSVPEGGRLLMISHGGVIEFGTCAALLEGVRDWGASLGYLEGVRLRLSDAGRWQGADLVRV
jgi:broad specificity phosphatase PhoE